MPKHSAIMTIASNIDLTRLNSTRIKVSISEEACKKEGFVYYNFHAPRIWLRSCQQRPFFLRLINKRLGKPIYYLGSCSFPWGIVY